MGAARRKIIDEHCASSYKSEFASALEAGNFDECLRYARKWQMIINDGNRILAPSSTTLMRHLIKALKLLKEKK